MKKMKKILALLVAILTLATISTGLVGCTKKEEAKKEIILATTTSTKDSGLLDSILPEFEKKTGYKVSVLSKGTGEAIKLGQDGNADVLLVHAKADEEKFVTEGHGLKRYDVMYNDFIFVGAEADPSGLKGAKDAVDALKLIAEKKADFVSRGDDSGTHKLEKKLWKAAEIEPAGDWYISAGKGMGDVLIMANEKNAYTISDRATYLSMKDKLDSKIVFEKSTDLLNQYGVIAVNPNKNENINAKGAEAFVNWIISEEAQKLIADYGKEKYGQGLFVPNAK